MTIADSLKKKLQADPEIQRMTQGHIYGEEDLPPEGIPVRADRMTLDDLLRGISAMNEMERLIQATQATIKATTAEIQELQEQLRVEYGEQDGNR